MIFRKFLIVAGNKFLAAYRAFLVAVSADGGAAEAQVYTNALLQTATNASIVQIPSAYKATVLYNQVPTPTGQDFTVARASDVTRTNEDGFLEVLGNNVPCIDYSDGFPVLLTQPQSTNLVTYSNDFSDASWTKSNATIISNTITSPDNSLNASKLVENSSTAEHIARTSATLTDTLTYTFSAYVKKAENDFIRLTAFATANTRVWFDLVNGVVGTAQSLVLNPFIIPIGTNGWFRIGFSYLATTTGVKEFGLFTSKVDGDANYLGDGISGTYIYGAQLEQLPYPTTIIPTSGATATRLADVITGAGSTASINSEEGVLVVEMAALADDNTINRYVGVSDGTFVNWIGIYFTTDSRIVARIRVNSGNFYLQSTTVTTTDFNGCVLKWKANDFELYIDGVSIDTNTVEPTFSADILNTLSFDRSGGFEPFYGKTKQLRVYPSISDAQLDLPYIT